MIFLCNKFHVLSPNEICSENTGGVFYYHEKPKSSLREIKHRGTAVFYIS